MPPTTVDEITAIRAHAASLAPGLRFAVQLGGADHREWLERIASNPVRDIVPGEVRQATLMDGKGKLRADLRVIAADAWPGLLLDVPSGGNNGGDKLLRLLDMYVIQDDVSLTDLRPTHTFVSVLGPDAAAVLQALDIEPPAALEGTGPAGSGTVGQAASSAGLLVLPSALAGTGGYDLLTPIEEVETLLGRLDQAGAAAVTLEALDIVRIERGLPWAADLDDGVIPLEAGLDGHVSITKGCYPGQEVVARILNLGQVARRLVRLEAPGQHALQAGSELLGTGDHADKPAGTLTSSAYDPSADCTRALGYVRRNSWSSGAAVVAAKPDGQVTLSVTSLADLEGGQPQ